MSCQIDYADGKYVCSYTTHDATDNEVMEEKFFDTLSGALAYAETYHGTTIPPAYQDRLMLLSWHYSSSEFIYKRIVGDYTLAVNDKDVWKIYKAGKTTPIRIGKVSKSLWRIMFVADKSLGIILGEVPVLSAEGILMCASHDFNTDENCCMDYEDYMDYYYNLTPQYIVKALRFYGDATGK